MLNWALKYQKLGLSVIPLRPNAKEPLIPWQEFQSRIATTEEIVQWWTRAPSANIGIVTGKISGVVVIDLDGPEGILRASELGLTSSQVSFTGKGKHLFYKHPGIDVSNAVRKYPGIDIRGDGGYVLAAPSVHPNQKRYRWATVFPHAFFVERLPVFPVTLFAKSSSNSIEVAERKEPLDVAKALEDMTDGNIDDTLFAICCKLRNDGWSSADALVLLSPHAARVGAEDGHLEAKIENVWNRYEPKAIQYKSNDVQSRGSELVIHNPANDNDWGLFNVRREAGRGTLISTFPKLDVLLVNGLKSERLFTVAALTGHGKTNFGIGLSIRVCEQGKKVLYFSTEFSYKKIWQRYIAALKDPTRFRQHAFHVCDGFTPSLDQVEEALIRIQPDIFVFDYIQHVSKERENLNEFMKGCQFLQRKYNTQGVILAQLGRKADFVENGKRIAPRMSMIEGSSTIEQASSRVLLLSLTNITPEMNEIAGVLDKNDEGDTGIINFGLYKNPYRLVEL